MENERSKVFTPERSSFLLPSPDLNCPPNRLRFMNTGIDVTKTVYLSATADASGSDGPAEKPGPTRESSQLRNENQTKPSYAGKLKHKENPRCNCNCSPVKVHRATNAPFQDNKFYSQVAKKLQNYGQIESISLDPTKRSHTVIYKCGCQASKAKNTMNSLSQPYEPPLNHDPEYFSATDHLSDNTDHSPKTVTKEPPPAPSYPRFFRIKPKGTPSVLSILASLTNAIGKVEPTNLTRARDHFILKVSKDSQSLMLTEGEYPPCSVVERITPHIELNTSRAVCHNKDLYNTPPEIIKCYATPRVQEFRKIKSSNNVIIITFPTNINALGLTYELEPYS